MTPGPNYSQPGQDPSFIGVYVHIPFCETKCPYCDFNTYAGIEPLVPGYIDALIEEVRRWAGVLPGLSSSTAFFGGGTPSYVPSADLGRVLAAVFDGFPQADGAEVTLEANPGDMTREKCDGWLQAGFNRVSMGVQSFDDGLLEMLGRRHTAAQAVDSFEQLREAGFKNRSLDLMFGLPDQSLEQWRGSLKQAIELGPDHLSLYGLQLEAGTPLEADVRLGRRKKPDDDLAADMYLLAEENLAEAGFRHYEISNWSKPGLQSRHNLVYWQNGPYLGVGPGAHSSLLGHRFANTRSPRWYMRSLGQKVEVGGLPGLAASPPKRQPLPESTPDAIKQMAVDGPVDFVEQTTPQLELAETMMMGLRLDTGVSEAEFAQRFGKSLRDVFSGEIEALCREGLLEEDASGIRLTGQGRLLGNDVFGRFVTAAEESAV